MKADYISRNLLTGRRRQIFILALLISIIIHIGFILLLRSKFLNMDLIAKYKNVPVAVSLLSLYNEDEPRQIVENMNENNLRPDHSDLLSDHNSRARSPRLSDQRGEQPEIGSAPGENMTTPPIPYAAAQPSGKKFMREDLGENAAEIFKNDKNVILRSRNEGGQTGAAPAAGGSDPAENYGRSKFSADELGDFSLSTYAWEWAPYVNSLKHKLYQVWFAPVAYYRLGLIYGYTVIRFSISRDGKLLWYKVLEHNGHESLQQSSVNAIVALFPFKALPANFPEDQLTIDAKLIYPNPRELQQ